MKFDLNRVKQYPVPGTPGYIENIYTGSKLPWTVVGKGKGGKLIVQRAKLIFHGVRYFNTVADEIIADPEGEIRELTWRTKNGCWHDGDYDRAYFGKYEHEPYTD